MGCYGNQCFGLARDRIEVRQIGLFTTTLILHSGLFTETHFNGIAFNEFIPDILQPKNIIAETNICFTNPNISYYPFFSVNICECLIYQQLR